MKTTMGKFLISACFIFSVITAYSQAKVEVGLKGGLNLANISSDVDGTYDSRTGYHVGAYGLIKVANIGIQPELLFSAQGTEYSYAQLSQDWSQEMKYILIPVMLKFYLPLGINLQAGPQFGILTNAEIDDGTTVMDVKDQLKGSDVSVAFGAGWDLPFGLSVTGRYLLGVNDINEDPSIDSKNRVFQVSVGFRLFKVGN